MLSPEQVQFYQEQGYLIVPQLFSQPEVDFFKQHYEAMRLRETPTQNKSANDTAYQEADPLLTYPRLMQPHRRDEASLQWLIDARLNQCMTALLGEEPFAVQTMFYFKPAGARGQALHQDQYYLRVQPGTCMAAWMAVDDCDEENGCLRVVPGSHTWPLLCTVEADTNQSFTDVTVPLPDGMDAVPAIMTAGDVLFFNGQIVHGSLPNISQNRFRRALIGHYLVGEAEQVNRWYHPVLRMDGSEIDLGISEIGGACGTWVDRAGEAVLEMQDEGVNRRVFD
jgi:ectoine hydroxylase-related dioxygenase (phytanoyl-CoA dioxygenase family)